MMSQTRNPLPRSRRVALMLAVAALFAVGCGKKKESTALNGGSRAAPIAPAPAPAPTRLSPADLGLAQGVQFPAERIPADGDAARAIAALANAIATGDADALDTMLDRADSAVLANLRHSGAWKQATGATKVVRVVSIEPSDAGVRVGLAIEDDAGAYLLGWEGQPSRDGWSFRALPVRSPAAARAGDLDGVKLALMDIPAVRPEAEENAPAPPPVDAKGRGASPRRPSGGGLGPGR